VDVLPDHSLRTLQLTSPCELQRVYQFQWRFQHSSVTFIALPDIRTIRVDTRRHL
jgi:hypothetical protein